MDASDGINVIDTKDTLTNTDWREISYGYDRHHYQYLLNQLLEQLKRDNPEVYEKINALLCDLN
jgi:hypothetical protein